MAYITQSGLEGQVGSHLLIQLTSDDDTDAVNSDVVNGAIAYAEGVFDSYIRARYSVPVPVTPMVTALNLDLAIFHLYRRRATFSKDGPYDVRKDAFEIAIRVLKDIGAGKAALDVPATAETAEMPATGDRILSGSRRPIVTDDKLSGF